jgi:phosphomethylpyrimidine synthase
MSASTIPQNDTITRTPFPGSRKIYAEGSDPSIKVPFRAIDLTDGTTHVVYDTSGPYTDPNATIDVHRGLEPLRSQWIAERDDTVELA